MKAHLETLKKWVQTGQVKTARGRSEDDLLTLIGQMELALSQLIDVEQGYQFGCNGCRYYNSCGIRMDYGNQGCDEYEK